MIKLKYGKSTFKFDFDSSFSTLTPPILKQKPPDSESLLEDALNNAEIQICEYLKGCEELLIVIPDRTRRCGLKILLPVILEKVRKGGVVTVKFLIASGTHARKGRESYRDILGSKIVDDYEIIEHDCDGGCVRIGTSKAGTPIELNSLIADAEKILCVGGMLPHYFAGFGGGPKLIMPGCASRNCIIANHRMTIHPEKDYPPGCRPGLIAGNPIIEDIIDAVSSLKQIYYIGIILGDEEKPFEIFAGELIDIYRKMASRAVDLFGVESDRKADLVIACPGGYPKDIDLLQSHKSLLHASYALKEGGELLFFAECVDGIGSKGMEQLFALGSLDKIRESLLKQYVMNGLTTISSLRLGERFRIKMMTNLDDNTLSTLGFERMNSYEEASEIAAKYVKDGKDVVLIPSASFTIIRSKEGV